MSFVTAVNNSVYNAAEASGEEKEKSECGIEFKGLFVHIVDCLMLNFLTLSFRF